MGLLQPGSPFSLAQGPWASGRVNITRSNNHHHCTTNHHLELLGMVEQAVHCLTPKGTAYPAYDKYGAPWSWTMPCRHCHLTLTKCLL